MSAREKNDNQHFNFDLNEPEDMTSAGTLDKTDRNTAALTAEEQE